MGTVIIFMCISESNFSEILLVLANPISEISRPIVYKQY